MLNLFRGGKVINQNLIKFKSSLNKKMNSIEYISKSANEKIEIVDENNNILIPTTRSEMRLKIIFLSFFLFLSFFYLFLSYL